jgi:AAHS family 4-hydroxybenzoate transporter-like MFS transporter
VTGVEVASTGESGLSSVLDGARFGAVQFIVLAFTFFTLVMDGFDIQAIAFAGPALTETWGISRSMLGPVIAAALVGMAIGAAGIGPLGDRHGRKNALIVSCVLMGVGSLASSISGGPIELAVFRFITGIGLGGALPNATALMFEFAPRRWRQIATSAALVGVPLGGMLGAAVARWLIPEFGWHALFLVGGVIPSLLAIAMWFAMPESPRFLSVKPDRARELGALLGRLDANARWTPAAADSVSAPKLATSSIAALFTPDYRRDTLTLWVILFTNVFAIYFFFSWLPTVLASANLDFRISVTGSLYFNLGGVVGTLASSLIMGRLGSRPVLTAVAIGAVISVIGIGANAVFGTDGANASVSSLMWTMAAAGACMNALQIGMFSVAANAYPTFCRSTGVGWGLAVARFGGIVSSFAGGAFFALGMQPRHFFFFIAGMLVLTLLSVILLRRHIPPTHTEAFA